MRWFAFPALAMVHVSASAQVSDIDFIPAHPITRTAESVTRPIHNYDCEFPIQAGLSAKLAIHQRGGRGYETGREDYPILFTPMYVEIVLNETPAEFLRNIEFYSSDGAFVLLAREDHQMTAYLVIEPDWSPPNFEIDGRASAELSWGPVVEGWFANDLVGECTIEAFEQEPLSEPETEEILSQ